MKQIILIFMVLLSISCNAQSPNSKFNLDFEQNNQNKELPDNWFKWGNYEIQKDTVYVYSGNYSSLIISDEKGSTFGSIAYKIPANYDGNEISLQGYMKIENVENGFAGLLLRIDGNGNFLAFDNMQNQNVKGTKDWKKYTITLPYPKGAENINVAGILSGKGKAWFDDFTLTIDGKNVQTLQEVEKSISKAQLDREFDNGSNFHLKEISKEQIKKLYKLGKIWGFLKYHHPLIAKGEVNWDYELFRILPKINSSDFENDGLKWIKSFGSVTKDVREKNTITEAKIQPNTNWITDNSFLSNELCLELVNIEKSSREKVNYYISFFPNAGNPNFQHENPYPNMKWDDTGYQLLALFRYWNIIEYFFPYKNLIEKNWDDVMVEYISKMISCNDELSYKLTILSLIGEIHDTHANIWQWDKTLNQFYGNNIAPLDVKFIDNKVVVVKTFNQLDSNSQIKVGDIIYKINGVETEKIVAEKIKYCPASNYTTKLRDVSKRLLRTNNNDINLTLKNQKTTYSEIVNVVPVADINFRNKEVRSYSGIDKDIGYIYTGSLEKDKVDEIMKSFLDKKGIIIDLRCYPSYFMVAGLGKYFMPEPKEIAKFTEPSLNNPGLFTFTDSMIVGEKNQNYFKGKIVILINEKTQSQAEFSAMAFGLAPKATIIGSTTAGADGNISAIMLPGNIRTAISGIGVYYPDGSETQRIGIVPDVEIKPTITGIRDGKDEVLEKAIELINE